MPRSRAMKRNRYDLNGAELHSWDLVRLSRSKELLDICANTLRSYNADGLPFYRMGRAVFVSKTELATFIRSRSMAPARTRSSQKRTAASAIEP